MSYQEDASRTIPSSDDLDKVRQRFEHERSLNLTLADVQREIQRVDLYKKRLFYGRYAHIEPVWPVRFPEEASDEFLHLLHAVLGILTEAGELIEAAQRYWQTGDSSLLAEELGDLNWYRALAATAAGLSLDQIDQDNIAKLKVRYPNRFAEEDAIRRRDKQGG